jgi:hypothetical protein
MNRNRRIGPIRPIDLIHCYGTEGTYKTNGAILFVILALMLATPAWADVESGPPVGEKVPALQALGVTGEGAGRELDFAAKRGGKPTLYVLLPAERWSRPVARLLRELDKLVTESGGEAYLVALWLTDDLAAAKEYLPKAQGSLRMERTALVACGVKAGPVEWAVNSRADVTVVVAKEGTVTARFGFVSANETVASEVAKAWKAAFDK